MVYSTRRFFLCLALCFFVLVFLVILALQLPHLGKRELVLVLFVRLFDLRLFFFFLFPLPLGVWEGLRFVIVALPRLFSYPFSFGSRYGLEKFKKAALAAILDIGAERF